ncbi:MAG: hypothetical protein AABW86_05100 [Candidatus Micrarchaeota archaeon]
MRKLRTEHRPPSCARPRPLRHIMVEDGITNIMKGVGSPLWMWGTVNTFHETPYVIETVGQAVLSSKASHYTRAMGLNQLYMGAFGHTQTGGTPNEKVQKQAAQKLKEILHRGNAGLVKLLKEMLEELMKPAKAEGRERFFGCHDIRGQVIPERKVMAKRFIDACQSHLTLGECEFCEPSFERGNEMVGRCLGVLGGRTHVMMELHEEPERIKDVARFLFKKMRAEERPPLYNEMLKDAAWLMIVSTAFNPKSFSMKGRENKRLSKMAMELLRRGINERKDVAPLSFDGRIDLRRTVGLGTLFAIGDVCRKLTKHGGLAHEKDTPLGNSVREVKKTCGQALYEEMPGC